MRENALEIFRHALDAVHPERAVSSILRMDGIQLVAGRSRYTLKNRVHLLASGKAAEGMCRGALDVLGDKVHSGLAVSHTGGDDIGPVSHIKGSHPVPDHSSIEAGKSMLDYMKGMGNDDFYVYLLSGGSSSLMELPVHPLGLADIREITDRLLKSGEDIHGINAVRRRLSMIKGGGLASAAPCQGIVLVISDVMDNDPASIGSGPFWPSETGFAKLGIDPRRIAENASVDPDLLMPQKSAETPPHYIAADNSFALKAAEEKAEELGYKTVVLDRNLSGEASRKGAEVMMQIAERDERGRMCYILGGETTVKVTGDGKGGRNQEFVLGALPYIKKGMTILSCGTDGRDGPTDAAGAAADYDTFRTASEKKLDSKRFLNKNNSFEFFSQTGGLVHTGSTGTNVCDIALILTE
ncbi:glycerate kinase type-2 family protein [Limisalsivibrio acetivorans]|uniref:glycerate kinase type-2 family protein n=1 Tax=Limisalsivibrio acetivorans TaxID=1304888 RepID=UPI0003B6D60B|nr:DUF4147 domain-containing protein [Limisalsivibrio acetivorans]